MSTRRCILQIKWWICDQTLQVVFISTLQLIYVLFVFACFYCWHKCKCFCHLSLQSVEFFSNRVSHFKMCRQEKISPQCFFVPRLSQGVFVVPAALQVLLRSVARDDVWRRDCGRRFHVLGWKWFGREVRTKATTEKITHKKNLRPQVLDENEIEMFTWNTCFLHYSFPLNTSDLIMFSTIGPKMWFCF